MKIKNDFVTNSSSCSYIVCIPNMEEAVNKISKIKELTHEQIDMLTKDEYGCGYIHFQNKDGNWDNDMYDDFHKIIQILTELGYPVFFLESGHDNECLIINIAHNEEMRRKIKNVMKG
jgi:hypothetical protein